MKSWKVHYENKYPGGKVLYLGEGNLDVYCSDGDHRVAIRNGVCVSAELGCVDVHDLSPIPRNARFRKLFKDGRIGDAEECASRRKIAEQLADSRTGGSGKVPSIEELIKSGLTFGKGFTGSEDEPHRWSWVPGASGKSKDDQAPPAGGPPPAQ